jgi:hypothetical protein
LHHYLVGLDAPVDDELGEKGEGDGFVDRHHAERGHDLLQLLNRPGARRHAAVEDETDRLVEPLLVE